MSTASGNGSAGVGGGCGPGGGDVDDDEEEEEAEDCSAGPVSGRSWSTARNSATRVARDLAKAPGNARSTKSATSSSVQCAPC